MPGKRNLRLEPLNRVGSQSLREEHTSALTPALSPRRGRIVASRKVFQAFQWPEGSRCRGRIPRIENSRFEPVNLRLAEPQPYQREDMSSPFTSGDPATAGPHSTGPTTTACFRFMGSCQLRLELPTDHEPGSERRSSTGLNRPMLSPLGTIVDLRTSKAGCKPALRWQKLGATPVLHSQFMGSCLFRLELLTDPEPGWKPVPAGRGYVRPHPGPLPQERGNRRQSQSQPMVPVGGRFMGRGKTPWPHVLARSQVAGIQWVAQLVPNWRRALNQLPSCFVRILTLVKPDKTI